MRHTPEKRDLTDRGMSQIRDRQHLTAGNYKIADMPAKLAP
jgi:hypothetical protein